mmetsp:Transcript_29458/g.44642  ORF Transcript_29458/g.44642 Transcript_29458/m.44642 type:complete len:363 (-) Transcript_29458:677-1765(-)
MQVSEPELLVLDELVHSFIDHEAILSGFLLEHVHVAHRHLRGRLWLAHVRKLTIVIHVLFFAFSCLDFFSLDESKGVHSFVAFEVTDLLVFVLVLQVVLEDRIQVLLINDGLDLLINIKVSPALGFTSLTELLLLFKGSDDILHLFFVVRNHMAINSVGRVLLILQIVDDDDVGVLSTTPFPGGDVEGGLASVQHHNEVILDFNFLTILIADLVHLSEDFLLFFSHVNHLFICVNTPGMEHDFLLHFHCLFVLLTDGRNEVREPLDVAVLCDILLNFLILLRVRIDLVTELVVFNKGHSFNRLKLPLLGLDLCVDTSIEVSGVQLLLPLFIGFLLLLLLVGDTGLFDFSLLCLLLSLLLFLL